MRSLGSEIRDLMYSSRVACDSILEERFLATELFFLLRLLETAVELCGRFFVTSNVVDPVDFSYFLMYNTPILHRRTIMAFPNISDILATTIESRTRKIADNVTKNNAILMKLESKQLKLCKRSTTLL